MRWESVHCAIYANLRLRHTAMQKTAHLEAQYHVPSAVRHAAPKGTIVLMQCTFVAVDEADTRIHLEPCADIIYEVDSCTHEYIHSLV